MHRIFRFLGLKTWGKWEPQAVLRWFPAWLPLLALIVTSLLAVYIYWDLRETGRQQVQTSTKQFTISLEAVIHAIVSLRQGTLNRMAARLREQHYTSINRWRDDAGNYLDDIDDLDSIKVIDAGLRVKDRATSKTVPEAIKEAQHESENFRSAFKIAAQRREAIVTEVAMIKPGHPAFYMIKHLPFQSGEDHFLVFRFNFTEFMNQALRRLDAEYEFIITSNGRTVFENFDEHKYLETSKTDSSKWEAKRTVYLPGANWQISARPNPVISQAYLGNAKENGALLAGMFFALLLSASLHYYRRGLVELQERVEAEEELRRSHEQKDIFLATLSHELRNPINVISGFSQLLPDLKVGTKPYEDAIKSIQAASKTQVRLISDLLDVTRISSGKIELNPSETSIKHLIDQAINSVAQAASAKDIVIKKSISAEIENIYCDKDRIHQVLWNLLSNAIKFTSSGGTIRLKVHQDKTMLRILVIDPGKGIPPKNLPYVFGRFWQGETSSKKHGGLGLGLSIVRRLVELHGGTVAVYSEGTNKGSVFSVSLPIRTVVAKQSPSPNKDLMTPVLDEPRSIKRQREEVRNKEILVVEDQPESLMLINRLLSMAGAKVKAAENGLVAMKMFKKHKFDFVVSDIAMPKMDGYALARNIRTVEKQSGRPPTPLVALTAYASEKDRKEAFEAGFQAHVSKPVSIQKLVDTLGQL